MAITLAFFTGAGAVVTAPSAEATTPSIYEWGKHMVQGVPDRHVPTVVQNLGAIEIDAGNNSDLAVLPDGTVWGWGATHVASPSMTAVQIPGLSNVTQRPVDGAYDFAALEQPGSDSTCPSSTTVMTWGVDELGDLGIGSRVNGTDFSSGQDVTTLNCANVVQIASAAHHMIALTADGKIYVWGGDSALGLGSDATSKSVPTFNAAATALTAGTSTGVEITAGSGTDGILVSGQAYCWGENFKDQCGTGHSGSVLTTPTAVAQGALRFTWIDQGGNFGYNGHTLAIDTSDTIWAWGNGAEGQLGTGGTSNSAVPVRVTGLPAGVVDVRAGGMHSLALDSSGSVWAWGYNAYGQVGTGAITNQLTPVKVLSGVSEISAGSLHSIAQ